MKKHLVFVYGTLRPPYGNYQNYLNNEGAKHLGSATTKSELRMFASGIPYVSEGKFLTEEEKQIFKPVNIKGDLFEVDDKTLMNLDRLEGHPNFYKRTPLVVMMDNQEINAEIYMHEVSRPERLSYLDDGSYHTYKGLTEKQGQ
jgi:gamma-glutamylaminecyclotransferase